MSDLKKRALGNSGLEIAPLVFGGNVFGWTIDKERSFEILDAFVGAGFNAIDTADAYSTWVPGNTGGESETIIGEWMKARGNRDRVLILTKVGSPMGQHPDDRKDLSPAWIERAVEDSLRRLQTDVIDLYQSHWMDPATPHEATLEAYDRLIKAGKVRAIGASNFDAANLKAALEVSATRELPRYETLQPHYNLYSRSTFEGPLQDLAVAEGIARGMRPVIDVRRHRLLGQPHRSRESFGPRHAALGVEIVHHLLMGDDEAQAISNVGVAGNGLLRG